MSNRAARRQIITALSFVLALCITWCPVSTSAHPSDDDGDDAVIWGYIFAVGLTAAAATSPIWGPIVATDEEYTRDVATGFQHYPYKNGSGGFLVLGEERARCTAVFTDLGTSVLDDDQLLSVSTELLTSQRIGLYFNQARYGTDAFMNPDRSVSSLHVTYLFARHENWAFSCGVGGRYEHDPIGETRLSGLYAVDWFPGHPFKLSGKYEYDGESHFRLACSALYQRVGVGMALRSEVIDNERHQAPEVFLGLQF